MRAPEVDRIVDQATEGLKDDRELRLDVRQELVSHIEESTDRHRAAGMGEEESLAESIRAFGPVTDIASELVSANRSRMRLRQLVRLGMRALLVPASLAVAIWIYMDNVGAAKSAQMISAMADYSILETAQPGSDLVRGGMSEETAFLFYGDMSRETKADQQRAIWENDPTNRVFYGNYITALVVEHSLDDIEDLAYLEKEIRKGEELDPENARYNYLLAGLMAEMASELAYETSDDGQETRVLKVKDRALLDKAMSEMLKGGEKPFMKAYGMEMTAIRFAELPDVRSLVEVVGRIGFAAALLLPDISKQRNLARTSAEYARRLIEEGRRRDALPYLEAWSPLGKMGFENSNTLIETLVAFAIVREGSNCVVQLEMLGEEERAAAMSRTVTTVSGVYDMFKASARDHNSDVDQLVSKHGGILHSLLIPNLGETGITKEDLAPGRQLEQTMIEKGWLSSFIASLLFVMFCFLILSLFARFVRGGESAPILLMPDAEKMLRVVVYSVAIPLAVFYLYTRHTDLAGRDMSMRMWPRFIAELHLLTVAMLSVAAFQMQKVADARCHELGLDTPGARSYWQIFLFSLIPLGLVVWLASGRRKSTMFRGTVARSLIPVLALIIVLVGVLIHPYLLKREMWLVHNDGILGMPREGGFTRIEKVVTERLNRDALAAIAAAKEGEQTN